MRFPSDFMFSLSETEIKSLVSQNEIPSKSQFGTSSWGGNRSLPFAFTKQGVAMLISVLNSDKAIDINIAIMRTFVYY